MRIKETMISSGSVVAALALFLLTGCATPISPETLANADYGSPPPKNYKELIKKEISPALLDPYSAHYEFSSPSKGYTRNAPMWGTTEMFGWKVCGTINAKNRFGAYVGSTPFFVLFKNGRVAEKLVGQPPSMDDSGLENMSNMNINSACGR